MADRSISVKLAANVRGYVTGMKTAQKATKDFATKGLDYVERHSQAIDDLSNRVGMLGLGLTAFAGLAVKKFADFDAAMSNVQASTMETAENMELLRDAALEAGQRTVFSATEAAGAVEELAKAGVSTTDIINGGLDGALDLAAAGGIAVADAAETAASAMTQFGLKGEDVTHIADLLAAGAGKAQGGVGDLGQAMKQSGLVAAQMGLSLEETVGALTAFASAGLTGSDAGTSFKSMLIRLANPTGKAADTLDRLNIEAYDAQGNFVGLADFAGQLKSALEPLPQAQRNAALATIFGNDAIRTANVLYSEGQEGIAGWIEKVDEQGYAAEVAAARLDNLKGDIEQLGGAFETALIKMGEGGDGALRTLVQGVTGVVEKFGDMPPAVQQASLSIVGSGGLTALGIAGMGKLAVSISEVRSSLKSLRISGKAAGLAMGGIGLAIGAASFALMQWGKSIAEAKAQTESYMQSLDEAGNRTEETIERINAALSENQTSGLAEFLGEDPQSLIDMADKFGLEIEDLQGYILGNADAVARVTAATQAWKEEHQTANPHQWEKDAENFTNALDAQANSLTDAEKAAAQKAQADEAAGIAQDEYKSSTAQATAEIKAQTDALSLNTAKMAEAAGRTLSLREAERAYEASLDTATSALKENGATLDITTEKGRKNQAALDAIADSTWSQIQAMRESGATQDELQAQMSESRSDLVRLAQKFGLSASEARDLADDMGLIPENVDTDVRVNTAGAQAAIAGVQAALNVLDGQMAVVTTRHRDVYESIRISDRSVPYVNRKSAVGGHLSAGTPSIVGEHGPELFVPFDSGMIFNHGNTRERLSGDSVMTGSSAPQVNVSPSASDVSVYVQSPVDGRWVRAEAQAVVSDEMGRVARRFANTSVAGAF